MKRAKSISLSSIIVLVYLFILVSAAPGMDSEDAPDDVILDKLSSSPIPFDHQMHVSYASCVECHHHTTGELPSDPICASCHRSAEEADSVSCEECHPIDRYSPAFLEDLNTTTRYHIDIPGLKGAYHLNCIHCHEAIGTGPTACQDCHAS